MKKKERKSSCDLICRPLEMIKLGELPLFMFSSSGTFGVTVTGRITNKQGLKEGLNPKAAGLVTKCMNSMGHKHRPYLILFLHLKEQRKHSEVPTASMKYVLLWYLSSSSCRVILGRTEDFLHYIPCPDITGRLFPSTHHHQKQLLALIYTWARCQQHTQGAT